MKRELEDECDYIREAESGRRFHRLLKDYDYFKVPQVVDEASTDKVLTVEWMAGKPLSRVKGLSQKDRDQVGDALIIARHLADLTAGGEHLATMPSRAVRVPLHADGSQLGKFPVRHLSP